MNLQNIKARSNNFIVGGAQKTKADAKPQQTTRQGRLEDSPKCPLTRGRGVEAGTSALPTRWCKLHYFVQ
jgi:hypothetical protein